VAEPETIDKGFPVQINKIFGSKENLFFTVRHLFFSKVRGARVPADAYVGSAPAIITILYKKFKENSTDAVIYIGHHIYFVVIFV
jgi:hypothetical protein